MSQLFTATDVTATNGNKFIQVNTGDDVSLISPNSWIQIGNGRIQEVKTVNTSATPQTIELFDNWNGASGSGQSAISAPTAAEIKAAAEEIRQLRVTYEGIAGDVNVSAAANSIAKRDSNGRLKATAPVASDDVVNRGFLGTAATRDVGTASGNVMQVGAFGWGTPNPLIITTNEDKDLVNGAYTVNYSTPLEVDGGKTFSSYIGTLLSVGRANGARRQELLFSEGSKELYLRIRNSGFAGDSWTRLSRFYHSGNTNFNEFGANVNEIIALGEAITSTIARFYLPISNTTGRKPISLSFTGSFDVFKSSGSVISGVTAGSLASISSPKMAIIDITGTGLTLGDTLSLRCANNNSKITVNS